MSAPTPEKSKSISDDEKQFIMEQVGQITSSPATVSQQTELFSKTSQGFRRYRAAKMKISANNDSMEGNCAIAACMGDRY